MDFDFSRCGLCGHGVVCGEKAEFQSLVKAIIEKVGGCGEEKEDLSVSICCGHFELGENV